MIREWLLKKITSRLDHRVIETDGRPYLTRWYLWPGAPRKGEDDTASRAPLAVFIHFFHRGDDDRDPHNHPWDLSASLVLTGGYHEERMVTITEGGARRVDWVSRIVRPWSINLIRGEDFHRVELLRPDEGCWTIFVAGRNVQDWGFKERHTGRFVPWQAYLMRKAWRNPTT